MFLCTNLQLTIQDLLNIFVMESSYQLIEGYIRGWTLPGDLC